VAKRRHLARRVALQVLYANEYLPDDPGRIAGLLKETGEVSGTNWSAFSRELASKTIEEAQDLDRAIERTLENWRIERLSVVDHLILRLALCEMRCFPDIPIRVTLDEYVELAKEFGTDDSSSFVNGILDSLARKHADKDFQQKKS